MSRVAATYAVSYTQYRFVLRHFAIIQERFFLVNLFTLFFTGAIMLKHCRYSSSVEHDLPKVERWVRFPLPALKGLSLSDSLFYFSFDFGKLSVLNLLIKKSAVDLAESHTCAVLHKGQNKAHRQSH